MISLRISSRSKEKIELIAKILLEEKLAIDIFFVKNIKRVRLVKNRMVSEKIHVLTTKTKALLFPDIDDKIRKAFGDEMPDIFSLPVVHMDWDKRDQLASDVVNV